MVFEGPGEEKGLSPEGDELKDKLGFSLNELRDLRDAGHSLEDTKAILLDRVAVPEDTDLYTALLKEAETTIRAFFDEQQTEQERQASRERAADYFAKSNRQGKELEEDQARADRRRRENQVVEVAPDSDKVGGTLIERGREESGTDAMVDKIITLPGLVDVEKYVRENYGDPSLLPGEIEAQIVRAGTDVINAGGSLEEAEKAVDLKAAELSGLDEEVSEGASTKSKTSVVSRILERAKKVGKTIVENAHPVDGVVVPVRAETERGTVENKINEEEQEIFTKEPPEVIEAKRIFQELIELGEPETRVVHYTLDQAREQLEKLRAEISASSNPEADTENIPKPNVPTLRTIRPPNTDTQYIEELGFDSSETGPEPENPEERLEKYGKTFELREQILEFRKARTNLAVLEKQAGGMFGAKYKAEYLDAKLEYDRTRAEYVGIKTWRALKEKKSLAEEKAELQSGAKFEKIKKGWRWLGDQNLEKLLKGTSLEAKGKAMKFLTRMVSLRTLTSFGLLGIGAYAGFGIAASSAVFGARRLMSGTGAAFGSYDLMRSFSDKRALSLSEEDIKDMSLEELQKNMSVFEARARLSGKRVVRSKEYDLLRRALRDKLENDESDESVPEDMREISSLEDYFFTYLDKKLKEEEASLKSKDTKMKAGALGIGLLAGGGTLLGRFFGADKAVDIPDDVLDEASKPMIGFDNHTILTEGPAPAEFQGLSEEEIFNITGKIYKGSVIASSFGEITTTGLSTEGFASTIEEGGSLWRAGKKLIEMGHISKEQFAEAWSNSNSTVELLSGKVVHISEAGLVHEGDQLVYVPATEGTSGHFEVIDFVGDNLHIGDNNDLIEALVSKGREIPEWLKSATESVDVGAADVSGVDVDPPSLDPSEIGEVMTREEVFERINEIMGSTGETGAISDPEAATAAIDGVIAEGSETVKEAAKQALEVMGTIDLVHGSAEFVANDSGTIREIVFNDIFVPGQREIFVNEAVTKVLKPNYTNYLEADLTRISDVSTAWLGEVMPQKIALAKEAAWRVFRLQELITKLEPHSKEWYFTLAELKKIVTPVSWIGDGKTAFFNKHLLNTEIFNNIKLPQ